MAHTFDEADAFARARAEVDLELNRWKRRLKDAAIRKTQALLAEGHDPVEAGRKAALESINSDFYGETPALSDSTGA